jgi:hypothetical protein
VNDSEARHVIDQFNKYASWEVGYWGIVVPYFALLIALLAFVVAAWGYHPAVWSLLAIFAVLLATAFGFFLADVLRRRSFRYRLELLESYRSAFNSLPDQVTFSMVTRWKAVELRKVLDESASSINRKGHL